MIYEEIPEERETDLSAEDCRAQLARILNSTDFEASARKHRFLSYVVDETLAGRGSRIKAYSIAVNVFGRDASFDPQADPIVRIEAGDLRRALDRYYLGAGQGDPILITVPKGGYIPSFSPRDSLSLLPEEPTAAPESPRPRVSSKARLIAATTITIFAAAMMTLIWWNYFFQRPPSKPEVPRLLVEGFDDLTGSSVSVAFAQGLTQEVISQLSKFKDIVVVQPPTSATLSRVRFALAGSVNLSADSFRFQVRLVNRADGSVLWAHTYGGATTVSDLLKAQADIASNVAISLAQAYGVIFEADARLVVLDPPDDWAAYSCTLSYYSYRVSFDPKALPPVQACLEKAVARFPSYATAWALLSLVYIDEMRFSYPMDTVQLPQSLNRALAAADRAVELEPLNVRGLHAQMLALYFKGEIDAATSVGRRAMTINPNDTMLMGEYGDRLALSGNWKEACPLVAEAHERNSGPLAYYEVGLALCSYFKGDYQLAAKWIRKANVSSNALYHVIATAIFAEAGFEADVERERNWLSEYYPALITNIRQETLWRFGRREDAELFLGSLKKAGLRFAD
ncbi:TolB-like protein [Rhizobium sp. BK312]|uniref:tetratricopeptide repeat protein n=1 Tax=Rhizobium sp. BK312 TaxID=2587080 RepID=UPI000DD7E27F|nr:hypothetical protein [Rhizobium sp. BK312]MBB3428292.1 TolB-like protein [Rhizobium sp. BK312]